VSAGYYLRIVRAMFFGPAQEAEPPAGGSAVSAAVIAACALAVIVIGIASSPLLAAISFGR